MLTIIYPSDPTTHFLNKVLQNLIENCEQEKFNVILVDPTQESYTRCIEQIKKIPTYSTIVFMGHGQNSCLYGAESNSFEKKPLIDSSNVSLLSDKFLFSLSCNSSDFLKRTYKKVVMPSAVGFGNLPTDMTEVNGIKRYESLGVNEQVIDLFRLAIVDLVSKSLVTMINQGQTFSQMIDYFMLRLNKKISEVVLNNKTDENHWRLANLLFMMKSELVFIG